jgi:hypothetical protein
MGEELLIKAGLELIKGLLQGALGLAKTLNIPDAKIDAAFAKAKAEFDANDPTRGDPWRSTDV